MEIIYVDPETNYQYGKRTFCRLCRYFRTNDKISSPSFLKGTVNGKKKKIQIKRNEMYCTYGDLFKINRNHVRWWGFSRNCPFNIYSHTCLGCGIRMCSPKEVCSGCLKNNDRFNQ